MMRRQVDERESARVARREFQTKKEQDALARSCPSLGRKRPGRATRHRRRPRLVVCYVRSHCSIFKATTVAYRHHRPGNNQPCCQLPSKLL